MTISFHQALLSRLKETLSQRKVHTLSDDRLRPAAVAVLLLERQGETRLLMTRRAQHLRTYPGQLTFPGGGRDKEDASLEATMLRELFEEIGVSASEVEVLGYLDEQSTKSGYCLTPIVAALPHAPSRYQTNPDEVEEVLELSLSRLVEEGLPPQIPYKTAVVISQLLSLLS